MRQTNTPRLTLAQVGPLPPHSAQRRLGSSLSRAARARRWASAWARVTEDLSAIFAFCCFSKEVEVEKKTMGAAATTAETRKKQRPFLEGLCSVFFFVQARDRGSTGSLSSSGERRERRRARERERERGEGDASLLFFAPALFFFFFSEGLTRLHSYFSFFCFSRSLLSLSLSLSLKSEK